MCDFLLPPDIKGLIISKINLLHYHPTNIYLIKVKNKNTRKRCENTSVSIVDFEQVNVRWEGILFLFILFHVHCWVRPY